MPPVQQTGLTLGSLAIAEQVITANQTTTATTSGTSTVLATLGPVETIGGVYIVELWAVAITKGTTNVSIEVWVDGVFSASLLPLDTNATNPNPRLLRARVVLAPGVHTITLRGFVDAGTGTLVAGAGTTGVAPNAVARLYIS